MSIRTRILLPLMAFMVLAGILSGVTGLVGLGALGDLSAIADRTSEANDVSRRARERFRMAENLMGRVTAMTDLIDMAPVQAEFTAQANGLTALLGQLTDLSASETMRATAQAALADSRRWRADAETLLGIRQAAEIPTLERMSRHSQRLRESFDRSITLAAEEGRAGIRSTREATGRAIWVALGLAAALVAAGAGAAWWLARSLSRPLVQLTVDATRLARGDTSVQLTTAGRRDEIGDIARAIVQIRDISMEEAARQLTTTEALRLREEEARRSMLRDLADGFERSVGAIVIRVAEAVKGLQGSSGAMRVSVEGTADRSASAAGAARQTSENVNAVAVAAEEIRATVGEIGRQVDHASGMSASAVQAAARTQGSMAELSAAATRIGDVIGLVSTIAGQTNLLALNATIEAARAGAAGRGFAVVAAEVKELAGQTSRATEEIVRQVAAIQAATGGAAHAIHDISEQINAMNGLTAGIAAAVEQQNVTAQEIARSMSQASDGTDQVTHDISEVARSAGEAGQAASAVARAADDLAGQSGALRAEVEHFLANVRAA